MATGPTDPFDEGAIVALLLMFRVLLRNALPEPVSRKILDSLTRENEHLGSIPDDGTRRSRQAAGSRFVLQALIEGIEETLPDDSQERKPTTLWEAWEKGVLSQSSD